MSLAGVVDALAQRLRSELGAGTTVGDVLPTADGDLPAVTLALVNAVPELGGVGRVPQGTQRGALEVSTMIDLADPVLRLGGEEVDLLSGDRRELILPQGQLVRADGSEDPPFDGDDVQVSDPGGAYAVVAGQPAGRQVRPDPTRGVLVFGQPLPAAGMVAVTYHLGQWDTTTERVSGDLSVEVTAADPAALASLSRQTAAVLDGSIPAFPRLTPAGWGAAVPPRHGPDTARSQVLSYRFDFENEEPSLQSGGGVIRTVAVAIHRDGSTEQFDVPSEGGNP